MRSPFSLNLRLRSSSNKAIVTILSIILVCSFIRLGFGQSLGPNSASARIDYKGAYYNVSIQYDVTHTTLEDHYKTHVKINHVVVHSVNYQNVGYNNTKNRGDISFPYTLYSDVYAKTEIREALLNQGYETQTKEVYTTFTTNFIFYYKNYNSATSEQRKKTRTEWRSKSTAANISIKDIGGLGIDNILNDIKNTLRKEKREKEAQDKFNQYMNEGDQFTSNGDFDSAMRSYDRAADLDVDNDAARQKYSAAQAKKQEQESKQEEEQNQYDNFIDEGKRLLEEDDYEAAKKEFEKAESIEVSDNRASELLKEVESMGSSVESEDKNRDQKDEEDSIIDNEEKRKITEEKIDDNKKNAAVEEHNKKREEYNKKQQEYEAKQRQQQVNNELTRQNTEAAAQLGVAAILFHILIGQQVYKNIYGVYPKNRTFKGTGDHHHIEAGYGGSFIPFNHTIDFSITIDLGIKYRYDVFNSEYGNFGVYGSALGGHSLQAIRYDIGAGIESSFGASFMKLSTNLRFNRRVIRFSEWIDASSNYKTDVLWKYARVELGPRFSWKKQSRHLEMLFGFNTFTRNAFRHPSYRFNFQANNKLKFHLEYARLSGRYNSGFEEYGESLPYFEFGVYRTWNTFKKGSYDYSFDQLQSAQKDNNWYFSVSNPIISWGELRNGNIRVTTIPNYAFNLASVEKEFALGNNFSTTVGVGITVGRGYTGEIEEDGVIMQDFFPQTFAQGLNLLKTRSKAEIDLPLGLYYYIPAGATDRFWMSFQLQPSFNLGSNLITYNLYQKKNYDPVDLPRFTQGNNLNTKLGMGFDLSANARKVYRIGLYHIWTSGFLENDFDNKLRGLQVKFAIGI